MKIVIVESPYAARPHVRFGLRWLDRWMNKRYARKCLKDCLMRGESPLASHLLYTQVLDDGLTIDRMLGIRAGHAWMKVTDKVVVYRDRGLSKGMQYGIQEARKHGLPVEERWLTKGTLRVR